MFDLVAEFTEDGRFTWVNSGYSRILGYKTEELIGQNGWETVHPDELSEPLTLEDMQAGHLLRLRHRSGGWRLFEGVSVEYRTAQGELRRLGIARDVTAKQETEIALRQSEERYRALAENAGALVSELDADGRYVYVNERHRLVLGYSFQDLIGHRFTDWVLPQDHGPVLAALGRSSPEPIPSLHRYRAVHRDGSLRWIDSSIACWSGRDGSTRRICVGHDVTREQILEESQRQLQAQVEKLERLDSLATLVGGIAHDFNNVLLGVLGHAELALDDIGPRAPAREAVEKIIGAAERAADLVSKLLDSSGQINLARRQTTLNEVAREAIELIRGTAPANVSLLPELSSEGETPVFADPTCLVQVILNLLTNAIEAIAPETGVVRVLTGTIQVRVLTGTIQDGQAHQGVRSSEPLQSGRNAFIKIVDSGSGIDPETIHRVFEPFFTTKFKGRGLGLSSVLGVVRAHEGAVDVASELGEGTTFTVFIPVLQPRPRPGEERQTC